MDHLHELDALVDRFDTAKILVIGDMMLDRFIWGQVSRISPEAPVPVVRVTKESVHLGGAANVVSNVIALGGQALPIGLIGEDEPARALTHILRETGVSDMGMVVDEAYQTIQKTRIIAHQQQVVRVDREPVMLVSDGIRGEIRDRLKMLIRDMNAVVVSDYGKAVIDRDLISYLNEIRGETPVIVDPKDKNFQHYLNLDLIKPNKGEAERLSGVTINNEDDLERCAAAIFKKLNCQRLLITLGEMGMALFDGPDRMLRVATRAREIFDVSGAGDTVISTYTMARAVGGTPHQAALLANAAAGVVVGKLGTATLSSSELKAALRAS